MAMDKQQSFVPADVFAAALEAIKSLPQAPAIFADEGRAERWIEAAYAADPERLMKHIERAGSLTGTELGVAAIEFSGGFDPFDSLRDIVRRKLLMETPTPPNAAMEIASALKPHAKQLFHEKFKSLGCVVDENALAATLSVSEMPWATPAIDDVVLIDGKRILVNYTVTVSDNETYSRSEIPTRYVIQMQLGAIALEKAGFPVDGVVFAPLVKDPDGYFKLRHFSIKRSAEHESLMKEAGAACWAKVCASEVPDYPSPGKTELESDSDYLQRLTAMAQQFASYDSLASAAYRQSAELKKLILSSLSNRKLGEGVVMLGDVVTVTTSSELDVAKSIRALGDEAKDAKVGDEYVPEKLAALLAGKGLSPDGFSRESRKVSLVRSGKTEVASKARQLAETLVEEGRTQVHQVMAEEAPLASPARKASAAPGM